jgi:hypothetical protein
MLTTFTIYQSRERLGASLFVDLTRNEAHLTLTYDRRISSLGTFPADSVSTPSKAEHWFGEPMPIVSDAGVHLGFETRIAHFLRLAKIEDAMGAFLPASEAA